MLVAVDSLPAIHHQSLSSRNCRSFKGLHISNCSNHSIPCPPFSFRQKLIIVAAYSISNLRTYPSSINHYRAPPPVLFCSSCCSFIIFNNSSNHCIRCPPFFPSLEILVSNCITQKMRDRISVISFDEPAEFLLSSNPIPHQR